MQAVCNSEKSSNFIKNIFLASEALQTFLNKYDENQRNLKSDDSLQNNSTSSDIDESSNTSLNEENKKQKKHLFGKDQHISISTIHPGTVVIYESTSTEAENINSLKTNNKATNKAHRLHIVSNQVNTDKDSDQNDSDEIQDIPIEISAKKNRIVHNKTINKSDKKVHKRNKSKIFQNILGEKTRFSIQRFRSNTSKSDIAESKIAENARRIKKIIYSERFSPKNIWQEIISRPIQLNKDSDSDFRTVNFRSKNNDYIPYVIVTENKKVIVA